MRKMLTEVIGAAKVTAQLLAIVTTLLAIGMAGAMTFWWLVP